MNDDERQVADLEHYLRTKSILYQLLAQYGFTPEDLDRRMAEIHNRAEERKQSRPFVVGEDGPEVELP